MKPPSKIVTVKNEAKKNAVKILSGLMKSKKLNKNEMSDIEIILADLPELLESEKTKQDYEESSEYF